MHEFSIGQTLVEAVVAELAKVNPRPRRLLTTRVVVGDLRQIVPDFLAQAYEILIKDTPAEGSQIAIRRLPIVGRCQTCVWQGEMPDLDFRCPSCGALQVDIVGGKEMYLEAIEVEEA